MISAVRPAVYVGLLAALVFGGFVFAQSAEASSPPSIGSVDAYPSTLGPNENMQLMVQAYDDVGITSMTANGVDLWTDGYGYWYGDLTADIAPGQHTILVTARDGDGNVTTNSASSYRTLKLFMLSTRAVQDSIIYLVQYSYRFKFCGKVNVTDENNFTLDDGSGPPIPVTAFGHGLVTNHHAVVYGALSYDFLMGPSVFSSADRIKKLD